MTYVEVEVEGLSVTHEAACDASSRGRAGAGGSWEFVAQGPYRASQRAVLCVVGSVTLTDV